MKKMVFLQLLLISLSISTFTKAQTYEDIFEQFEDANLPDLAELFRNLIPEPIPINSIPGDSIANLWFLNEEQITGLIQLYQQKAPKITLPDIVEATGLPSDLVSVLFTDERILHPEIAVRSRSRFKSAGLQQDLRFNLNYHKWAFGFLNEKDAGEKRWDDFLSGYSTYHTTNQRFRLLFGDFTIQAAAGLIFAGPFGLPTLTLPQSAFPFKFPRFRPYRSVQENTAFRGVATQMSYSHVNILAFYSKNQKDAIISKDHRVISLPLHGYHRTPYELSARKRLLERSQGVILNFSLPFNLNIGFTAFQQVFNYPIWPPDSIRKHFDFRGRKNSLFGAHIDYQNPQKSRSLFAEMAYSVDGLALISGFLQHYRRFSLVAALWHSDPDYHSFYGALPGENPGETNNQSGIYLGLYGGNISGKFTFYAYRFVTPWRTYSFPLPVQRQEIGLQFEKRTTKQSSILARLRLRKFPRLTQDRILPQQRPGKSIDEALQVSWRIQFRIKVQRSLTYRVRLDGTAIHSRFSDSKKGLAQMHEFFWRPRRHFSAGFRYSYFSTDDFSSRIYQYESILPGLLRPVTLFNEGERIFAYLRVHFRAGMKISFYFTSESQFDKQKNSQVGLQFQL